jgi:hypothetical protein
MIRVLQRDGMADNFISFKPRKKHMIWVVRIDRDEELDARLEESGRTMLPYDKMEAVPATNRPRGPEGSTGPVHRPDPDGS